MIAAMATPTALDAAVDFLNEVQFYGREPARAEVEAAASYIASRQGSERAYAGSFGLTPAERATGIRVFTGEHLTSASARHVIGEECCRVLRNLTEPAAEVRRALDAASTAMAEHLLPAVDAGEHPACTAAASAASRSGGTSSPGIRPA
jgi:hypothetical protein